MTHMNMQLLSMLEKAIDTGTIEAIVPEDLEIEAHNTLWNESSRFEFTALKLIPNVPATSIKHEFTQITSMGEPRFSGFFSEKSLPPETNLETERVIVNIRLMGEVGPTFLLASLEKTQQVLGTSGPQNIERRALRLNILRKKNRNIYFSDTGATRLGIAGVRNKGMAQLIREGTDGTTGTSPFGSHAIDMENLPLTVETVREKTAEAIVLFGYSKCLIMDPFTRATFEGSMDSAQRLPMPINVQPYVLGQNIAGLQTQGGTVLFHTDNVLAPSHAWGQYRATLFDGAPTGKPVVVGVAQGESAPGKWDAASVALEQFWVVTETRDEMEGLGTRSPVAGTQALTVGQEYELTITPSNPLADSFRVYRGTEDDSDIEDAWFIYEVANTGGGGAVVSADLNLFRPNTAHAFALNIAGPAANIMNSGLANAYETAKERSAEFLAAPDDDQNTIAIASLGPTMGIMPLAHVVATVDRPLMYSAYATENRNPLQNFYFYNIGRAS